MVLLNISTLSDEEIRYIAQQEEITEWDTMSREDLIEEIQEIYEEEQSSSEPSNQLRHKFFTNISGEESDVTVLPGVEPVTDIYNKTYIHMVPKDLDWCYAFWEISESTTKEITAHNGTIAIRVKELATDTKPEDSFDIEVSITDRSWSIETSETGRSYILSLISKCNGEETVLAETRKYYKPAIWIKNHPEELSNPDHYRLLVRPLISKDGTMLAESTIREIIKNV